VPRGTPHAFTNESGAAALAYAVYVPPFDGKDREPVE
jgi:mannose-6-phosphate isomerase-like protein (cupin superfamily)